MSFKTSTLQGETLQLHPFKALFWQEKEILLLADLHLGKAAHFRKNGIPVPQGVSDANWDKLISLLLDFKPRRLIFLGDLFHSVYNTAWEDLSRLTRQFSDTTFELVQGNHDILNREHYESAQLRVYEEPLELFPFLLSHHPMEAVPEGWYNLAGHIHPCVYLSGQAQQRARLACFYFSPSQGILPAFGTFTGMAGLKPKQGDLVYVITDEAVIEV